MRHLNPIKSQAGMSLLEVLIASGLSLMVIAGGAQYWNKQQRLSAARDSDRLAKDEANDLSQLIRKSWDFRLQKHSIPSIPAFGYELLSANDQPCISNCPKLKVYRKRAINGVQTNISVLLENRCLDLTGTAFYAPLVALAPGNNVASFMNSSCLQCPSGSVPTLRSTGQDIATGQATLALENAVYPRNLRDIPQARVNGVVGAIACFSQAQPPVDNPLALDVRVLYYNSETAQLKSIQRTQVFPFTNFADVTLE